MSRTGQQPARPAPSDDPRIHVSLPGLLALEPLARQIRLLPHQPAGSVLNGRHASRLRGRGLNFEELRDYLPGDDIRAIDWKVTARTGTPHIRVMTEERDRPALIVVDQRMSMFFGSRHNMKAVTAAEAAALAAFAILGQGDRLGGIVFGDDLVAEIRPERSRRALMRFLTALTEANALLHAGARADAPLGLSQVLRAVARIAPRNHLILVLSDFDGPDDDTEQLMGQLARRNDLILGLVTDPLARTVPEDLRMVASDGDLQAEIRASDAQVHRGFETFLHDRLAGIMGWQARLGVPVLPLSSGEDTLPQLRSLLGLGPR
ncbi:MAG: DUF58 domain-containing protein [Marinibacterium sp.]|nr:DUF58 domain-containing protein [Marinibacterium sp.]